MRKTVVVLLTPLLLSTSSRRSEIFTHRDHRFVDVVGFDRILLKRNETTISGMLATANSQLDESVCLPSRLPGLARVRLDA